MATDFELTVLEKLSEIKSLCATNTQAHSDLERRVGVIEETFKTQDTRHWIKNVVVAGILLVMHPVVRKIGWDI